MIQDFYKTTKNYVTTCLLITICTVGFIEPAYADWFKVADIKTNLITPIFRLVYDNIAYIAFAVGAGGIFMARGQDMFEKAKNFGLGSVVTAGAIKLAETVMPLA